MKYELDKKTLKKYLKYQRSKTNIIFIIIGSLIYFYITYYLILNNPFITFIYYLLYLLILIIIILLFNELYTYLYLRRNNNFIGTHIITLKNDKIIINVNNNTYEYLNSNMNKIKNYNNYLVIKYNNHTSLYFFKNLMNSSDYNKILEIKKNSCFENKYML